MSSSAPTASTKYIVYDPDLPLASRTAFVAETEAEAREQAVKMSGASAGEDDDEGD